MLCLTDIIFLFDLIQHTTGWLHSGRLTLQIVARILSDRTVCNSTGLIMFAAVPPLSHMPSWCAQDNWMLHLSDCRNIVMVHTVMLFCEFLSLHSLETSNVFVSSSSHNTVILKIMLFPLLLDTVLYCLTYRVLSCFNCVVTVTETDGQ